MKASNAILSIVKYFSYLEVQIRVGILFEELPTRLDDDGSKGMRYFLQSSKYTVHPRMTNCTLGVSAINLVD